MIFKSSSYSYFLNVSFYFRKLKRAALDTSAVHGLGATGLVCYTRKRRNNGLHVKPTCHNFMNCFFFFMSLLNNLIFFCHIGELHTFLIFLGHSFSHQRDIQIVDINPGTWTFALIIILECIYIYINQT